MRPRELSRQLRRGSGGDLRRRRGIVGLSLLASASMGLITLYQMGIIRHLPEPPLPGLDADEVDASGEAYARLQTPDAALGLERISFGRRGSQPRAAVPQDLWASRPRRAGSPLMREPL